MTTTTRSGHRAHLTDNSDRNSRQLQEDIRHTREEMDETLDELGERLHPRHLLDDLIDLFRGSGDSDRGQQMSETCRRAGQSAVQTVREHPVPAALIAAGVAWWVFDDATAQDDEVDWDELGEYGEDLPGQQADATWRQEAMPWHEDYQWQEETEEAWTERSRKTLEDLRHSLSDETTSAQAKLKHVAGKLMPLAGHKQKEIHSRWSNLREHSGSFVDARTGEPYDENYAADWESLAAIDALSSSHSDEDVENDSAAMEKAKATVGKIQSALSQAGDSTKDTLRGLMHTVGGYSRDTGRAAKRYHIAATQAGARWGRDATEAASRTAQSWGRGTRRGAAATQRQLRRGYATARETTAEAIQDYPLAVGAACFGLGLIGGLLFPATEYEDELMGDTADKVKEYAQATGHTAYEHGKEVASATASAAVEQAKRQGVTPDQLAEKVEQTASKARRKVEKAAARTGDAVEDTAQRAKSVAQEATEAGRQKAEQKRKEVRR